KPRGGKSETKKTALLALLLLAITVPSFASAFPPCPQIGRDNGCGYVITINANGSITVTNNNLLSYDTAGDDTLIGVVSNWSGTVSNLFLTSSLDIFGFDADGAASGSGLVCGGTYGCRYPGG